MCIKHYQPIHAPHENKPTISEDEMIPCEVNWCIPHFWISPRAMVSTFRLRVLGAGPGQPGQGLYLVSQCSSEKRMQCSFGDVQVEEHGFDAKSDHQSLVEVWPFLFGQDMAATKKMHQNDLTKFVSTRPPIIQCWWMLRVTNV